VGVNVTLSACVPAPGEVEAVVQANDPLTDAVPPVSVDDASVWPYVIALAAGHAATVGVVFEVVPPPPPFPPPPPHPAANSTTLATQPAERSRMTEFSLSRIVCKSHPGARSARKIAVLRGRIAVAAPVFERTQRTCCERVTQGAGRFRLLADYQ
jgi:hypothetical protein